MIAELPFIQDLVGSEVRVAPFAKSSAKDIYTILSRIFNSSGELEEIRIFDFVKWKGEHIDYSKTYTYEGENLVSYMYDDKGALLRVVVQTEGEDEERVIYEGEKYLNYIDTIQEVYLKERVYKDSKFKRSFWYSETYKNIYSECIDREDNFEKVQFLEHYDESGRLESQYQLKCSSFNPAQNFSYETYQYKYDGERVIRVLKIRDDFSLNSSLSKLVFSDYDERNNWRYMERSSVEDEAALSEIIYTEKRDFAYDEESAKDLHRRFIELKEEVR